MTKDIELQDSFTEYATNELVKKLRELDPEDYENHGDSLDIVELLELLLEDERANGCYYLYTADSETVFSDYFNDILYICGRFGYADINPMNLNASKLLLMAMEHAFTALLQYFEHATEVADLKFNRAGLDMIAGAILDMDQDQAEKVIND